MKIDAAWKQALQDEKSKAAIFMKYMQEMWLGGFKAHRITVLKACEAAIYTEDTTLGERLKNLGDCNREKKGS